MKKVYVLILCVAIFVFVILAIYARCEKNKITSSVLRLHVVAQSDSNEDQALKLKVRDAVLVAAEDMFCNVKSKDEAIVIVNKNKKIIEDAAKDALLEEGYNIPVKVSVEKTKFPTKFYENLRLPAGIYDAVNVKIGRAEGKNWWCIMYPMLCFSDSVSGKLESDGEKKLIHELGENGFRLITDSEDEKIRIKFKILEFF